MARNSSGRVIGSALGAGGAGSPGIADGIPVSTLPSIPPHLPQLPICGERHLRRTLAEYAQHYTEHRPHQSRELTTSAARARPADRYDRPDQAKADRPKIG